MKTIVTKTNNNAPSLLSLFSNISATQNQTPSTANKANVNVNTNTNKTITRPTSSTPLYKRVPTYSEKLENDKKEDEDDDYDDEDDDDEDDDDDPVMTTLNSMQEILTGTNLSMSIANLNLSACLELCAERRK